MDVEDGPALKGFLRSGERMWGQEDSEAKRAMKGERRHSPRAVFKLPRIRGHSARSLTTCFESLRHLPGPRRPCPQSNSQRIAKSLCWDCMAACLGRTPGLAQPSCNQAQAQN